VSVPVLTANIESATARYGSLLGEEVKARFVMPGRGLTLALFGSVTLIGAAERVTAAAPVSRLLSQPLEPRPVETMTPLDDCVSALSPERMI